MELGGQEIGDVSNRGREVRVFFILFSAKAVQIKYVVEGEKRVRAAEQEEREGSEDETVLVAVIRRRG